MNATSKLNLSSICFTLPHSVLCHKHTKQQSLSTMAERFSSGEAQYWPNYGSTTTTTVSNSPIASFFHQLRSHSPTSSQLFGFLALFISTGILLFLLGVSVTAAVLGFIVFFPLIIISSPIWIPVFVVVGGFLTVSGFLVGTVALVSWTYRYFRGMHPVGSNQMDYARSRIYDTASHVKDYAREYGGYFHGRAKDAAPGAWPEPVGIVWFRVVLTDHGSIYGGGTRFRVILHFLILFPFILYKMKKNIYLVMCNVSFVSVAWNVIFYFVFWVFYTFLERYLYNNLFLY